MKKNYILTLVTLFASVAMFAQIEQVTDINKTDDSGIAEPYAWNGKIYFEADAGDDAADELYVYDGDSAYLLADINQDTLDTTPTGDPKLFIEFNGKLYFSANGGDKIGSDTELYETDGTTEGTKLTYDFNPIATKAGNPLELFVFDNKLMMQANDGGTQIWAYDGTNDPVKITNERDGGFFTPYTPMVDGDKVWLKGIHTNGKYQLWKLTADSIYMMTDNGVKNAYSGKGMPFAGGFIFQGTDEDNDNELWYSDGTAEGTSLLLDIDTADTSKPDQFTNFNDKVYFTALIGAKTQLWESDATVAGTKAVLIPTDTTDTDITNLTAYDGKLFFTLTTEAAEEELWAFDGESSTKIAMIGASPKGFIEVEGLLFFIADGKLWCTEGYEDVTQMVDSLFDANADYVNADDEYAIIGSKLYFTADDTLGNDDIYMIDASTIEREYLPILLNDIASLHLFNGELFFEAEDENRNIGDELYKQTAEGEIILVADINQDPEDPSPNGDPKYFIEYNGKLYFNGNGGDNTGSDSELYETDGTTEGTKLVFDFDPRPKKGGNPLELFIFDNKLMMQANNGTGTQIWAYDGSNDPTTITNERDGGFFTPFTPMIDGDKVWLKGIHTNSKYQLWKLTTDSIYMMTDNGVKNAYTGKGLPFAGGFLFQGTDEDNDSELWYSNGTTEGTALVLDLDTAGTTKPDNFIEYNGKVYFTATIAEKTQLWCSDATVEGTMVAYAPTDSVDAEIENLNVINGMLVFTANSAEGTALYKLTSEGAEMLAEVAPSPEDFYAHDGLLFFVAGDSLWYTEGTTASTMAVPASIFEGGVAAMKVDGGQFVSNGTLLHFVSEVDGRDVVSTIDAANIERDPTASISEAKSLAKEVTLYPMPSNGIINIASSQNFTSYKIFDLSMKEMTSSSLEGSQINVSLAKGIYIVQLNGASSNVTKRIMIK